MADQVRADELADGDVVTLHRGKWTLTGTITEVEPFLDYVRVYFQHDTLNGTSRTYVCLAREDLVTRA